MKTNPKDRRGSKVETVKVRRKIVNRSYVEKVLFEDPDTIVRMLLARFNGVNNGITADDVKNLLTFLTTGIPVNDNARFDITAKLALSLGLDLGDIDKKIAPSFEANIPAMLNLGATELAIKDWLSQFTTVEIPANQVAVAW